MYIIVSLVPRPSPLYAFIIRATFELFAVNEFKGRAYNKMRIAGIGGPGNEAILLSCIYIRSDSSDSTKNHRLL